MALQDFLRPGENIQFHSPAPVDYRGEPYTFYITNFRFIWHRTKGILFNTLFKKDFFNAEMKDKVTAIQYSEKGIFRKRSFITVEMGDRRLQFSGPLPVIRAIYSEMQAYMPELDLERK